MPLKKHLKKVCKEVDMSCFKLLFLDFADKTDEKHDSWSAG